MGALLRVSWLSFWALFGWADPAVYVSSLIVGPAFQIVFFTLAGRFSHSGHGPLFYVIGNAVEIAALGGVFALGLILIAERRNGTLGLSLIAPRSRLFLFAGRGIVYLLNSVVTVALGLGVGAWIFGLPLSGANLGALAVAIAAVALSTAAFGLLFAGIGLLLTDVNMVMNLAISVMLVLCGINFSINALPSPVRAISLMLPLTRGAMAARLAAGGAPWAAIWPLVGGEVLIGAVYFALGYVLFTHLEATALRKGTLDLV